MYELLTAQELADALGISRRCVYNMVSKGDLPFVRLGNRVIRFDLRDVLNYLKGRYYAENVVDQYIHDLSSVANAGRQFIEK